MKEWGENKLNYIVNLGFELYDIFLGFRNKLVSRFLQFDEISFNLFKKN